MFGCRKYEILPIHQIPLTISPLKEIWKTPRAKENLTYVGFEPTTSELDLPKLYRLSYETRTGAGLSDLRSESR